MKWINKSKTEIETKAKKKNERGEEKKKKRSVKNLFRRKDNDAKVFENNT